VGTRREERKADILALCDAVEAHIVSCGPWLTLWLTLGSHG
jgi:hypothetical protein